MAIWIDHAYARDMTSLQSPIKYYLLNIKCASDVQSVLSVSGGHDLHVMLIRQSYHSILLLYR
jgi:hypothetical protein